jgi:acetyl esterase/lipase
MIHYHSTSSTEQNSVPALVFVHGGAWGSGMPWHYILLEDEFLRMKFQNVFMGK